MHDCIPAIIEADGKTCITEVLSDELYLQMLDAKLNEELAEYQESKSLEELADLLEVMQSVVIARGWSRFLLNILPQLDDVDFAALSEIEQRMLQMLYVTIWGKAVDDWNSDEVLDNLYALVCTGGQPCHAGRAYKAAPVPL